MNLASYIIFERAARGDPVSPEDALWTLILIVSVFATACIIAFINRPRR